MLTKGTLAVLLSQLKEFNASKAALEQYAIPSEIAATVLWEMLLQGDIEDKTIADLGAGTGILGIGAAVLGARLVHLVDIDNEALARAKENVVFLENELGATLHVLFDEEDIGNFKQIVDVVVQNPPFGVQKKHADRVFLEKAFSLAPIVYSFHKTESEQFLRKYAQDNGFVITRSWLFDWPLQATMHYHEKRKHLVKVGAWRFAHLHYLKGKY